MTSTANSSTVVNIGDILVSNYADNGTSFSEDKLEELYSLITGTTGADYLTLENYFNSNAIDTTTLRNGTGYQNFSAGGRVIQSSQISSKTGGKDIVLTFGGLEWTVTSLTKNRAEDKLLLTLWLANSPVSGQWSAWSGGSGSYPYPCSMYGTSYVRNYILNNNGCGYTANASDGNSGELTTVTQDANNKFAVFTMPGIKGSLTDFIVTPAQVEYQEKLSIQHFLADPSWVNAANSAYGTPVNGEFKSSYDFTNKTHYADWKDDYIWLPSAVEIGGGECGTCNGIWNTSANQKTTSGAWLRDAVDIHYGACYLSGSSMKWTETMTNDMKICPALHLDLTAAAGASITKLTAPSGTVTMPYNGDKQSLSTLTSPPSWYNATVFGDTDIIVMSANEFTDAGDNEVTVTLIDGGYYWSDYESNPTNTRTFTFSITKKPLTVTFEENADSGLLEAKYDDTQLYDRDKTGNKKPALVTKYYKPEAPDTLLDAPNSLGSWYALAVLSNADTCNYSVDAKQLFNASKTRVAYPTLNSLSSPSQSYNNSSKTFMFKGYDSDLMDFTVPAGAESFDGTTLTAKKAGTYTIVYTLKDESLYEWSGNTTLTVEITKYVLGIVPDDNLTEWVSGTETALVFLAAPMSGDSVQLAAKISKDGGDGENIAVVANGDGTHTVTIPSIYLAGDYTLTVKVADGENYTADEEVFEFTIQGESFDLDENNIRWLVNNKTYSFASDDAGYLLVPYTGSDITFTVDIRAYAYLTVESYGGTQTAKEIGDYEVTVHIIAKDNAPSAFDNTFTLKYKIVPKVLNFDNAVWQWQYDGDTEWETMSEKNMPPYDGRAVNVRISPDYFTDLGLTDIDYTVTYLQKNDLTEKGNKETVATITIANENYTTADGESCEVTKEWEITARALKYQWNATQTIKAVDRQFEFAAITFEEEGDYSQYFEYYYTVDGQDGEFTKEQLEAYLEANWSETTTITGKVGVRMTGVSEDFEISESFRSFSTGASKTALAVAVTTSETAAYGDVGFAFTVKRGEADERVRTTVTIAGQTFDGNKVKEIADFINTLDAGNYTVTVSVKDENSYMLTGDYSYPLTISPAELKVKWNNKGTLDHDVGGYQGSLDGLFTYTYTDADGNEVETLEKGKTYKVVATLKDSVKKNFTMSDEMSLLISTPYEFTMGGGGFDIMSMWWIFVIIAAVLLIIILVVVIVVVKKRKAAAAGYDDYYDDDYDYDDDGENYGEDGDYNGEDYDYDGEEYDDGGGDGEYDE